VVLSHEIPDAPSFSPSNGESVDRNNTVITWSPVAGVASYQVIVENEDLGVVMTVDLSAAATTLQVPPTFLEPDTEYKAEVLAIGPSGNRTITEGTFGTLPWSIRSPAAEAEPYGADPPAAEPDGMTGGRALRLGLRGSTAPRENSRRPPARSRLECSPPGGHEPAGPHHGDRSQGARN
jgi:hypothetical protein